MPLASRSSSEVSRRQEGNCQGALAAPMAEGCGVFLSVTQRLLWTPRSCCSATSQTQHHICCS